MSPRPRLLSALVDLFRRPTRRVPTARPTRTQADLSRSGPLATVEIPMPGPGGVRLAYAPRRNGMPDAGEIVWAWVPFQENDGRGKDRPLLVIARHDDQRVLALKLTSKSHDLDRDYLAIGTGSWDVQSRPSWVDVDQVYSVHQHGIRREASALDPSAFARVSAVLQQRYGWIAAA